METWALLAQSMDDIPDGVKEFIETVSSEASRLRQRR